MNNVQLNIMPVTQARSQLGTLTDKVKGEEYIVLTKGGLPRAVLVDYAYLIRLQNLINRMFQKTYISPDLLPFTREFTNKEINEWQKEDQL